MIPLQENNKKGGKKGTITQIHFMQCGHIFNLHKLHEIQLLLFFFTKTQAFAAQLDVSIPY